MKFRLNRFSLIVFLLSGLALSGFASPAHSQPDFTGIWTNYSAPGQGPARREVADLPFTEEGARKVAEYRALIGDSGVTPGGMCLGTGMPGSMLGSGGYPMEIIQRPEQITVIYEAHSEIRRIFIGENRFPMEERFPDRNGYSEGHWEGDTLVVETTHLKEQVDQTYAHSDQATIVERYSLSQAQDGRMVLTAEMTMTDPVFYREPVTATKTWARVPNARLLPYECNEPAWETYLDSLREQDQ